VSIENSMCFQMRSRVAEVLIRTTGAPIIRPMNGNQLRDTPGRMLLLCSVLMLPLVVFAWRVHLGRGQFDWVEYPSALGDSRYYSDSAMIGENDFFGANLKFAGHEKGLFRRTFKPRTRKDEEMRKVAMESTGRYFVYTEARQPGATKGKSGPTAARHYLKSGENRYIEFGARKYYPEDPTFPSSPKAPAAGGAKIE
jgi:hypothetical protein